MASGCKVICGNGLGKTLSQTTIPLLPREILRTPSSERTLNNIHRLKIRPGNGITGLDGVFCSFSLELGFGCGRMYNLSGGPGIKGKPSFLCGDFRETVGIEPISRWTEDLSGALAVFSKIRLVSRRSAASMLR